MCRVADVMEKPEPRVAKTWRVVGANADVARLNTATEEMGDKGSKDLNMDAETVQMQPSILGIQTETKPLHGTSGIRTDGREKSCPGT